MKTKLLILILISISYSSHFFATEVCSGCVQGAGFEICGATCDDANANPLEVCFCVGGAYDLPGSTAVFWDFGDGTTSTAPNPCHTYATGGTYTVYRRMTINCSSIFSGCYLHMFSLSKVCDYSKDIVVYDQSFASSLSTSIVCPDNYGTATFAPSSTDGVSWMWDAAPSDINYQPDPTLPAINKPITNSATNLVETNLGPGAHNLYYSYGAGCYGLETFNFDLVQADSILITQDYNGENVSCFDASDGQTTAYASGGVQPLTYTWNNGFTETNSTGSSVNNNIPAGSYSVDITDANGCLVEENITLTQPDELLANTLVSPTLCGTDPVTGSVEITSITGGVPTYTVLWSTGDNQLSLTGLQNDTYDYTITDLNGCELAGSLDLHNSAQPTANFTVNNECLYNNANFVDASTSSIGTITTWDWLFDDGGSSNDQNPNHEYQNSGDYNPTLTVTNSDNCSATTSTPFTMYPVPVSLFQVDNECLYDSLCFTNQSTIQAPDNITSYIYNFGDGSLLSSLPDPCHLYSTAGDYQVTFIVSSNNGCVKDTTIGITVFPIPNINFSATTVCLNEPPTVFTNSSTIQNPDNFLQWEWDFGDGYSASLENTEHTYNLPGDYTVELVGITNNNCSDTSNTTVTVYEIPASSFTSNIQDSCSIACINFESTSTSQSSTIENWEWNFNNDLSSTSENPTSCFENESNTDDISYDISLITTNDLGCSDTLNNEGFITVWHNPIADYESNEHTGNMYTNSFEFSNLSIGADSYYWDFNDGNNETSENPTHSYSDTGSYNVMLISSTIHNCTDTTWGTFRVDAITSIYAPNTFTPNNDQKNDYFKIVGYNIKEVELLIFDRWGTLLYSGTGLDAQWDGKYKGKNSQQDTYVWKAKIIDGFGKQKIHTGHVNLLR